MKLRTFSPVKKQDLVCAKLCLYFFPMCTIFWWHILPFLFSSPISSNIIKVVRFPYFLPYKKNFNFFFLHSHAHNMFSFYSFTLLWFLGKNRKRGKSTKWKYSIEYCVHYFLVYFSSHFFLASFVHIRCLMKAAGRRKTILFTRQKRKPSFLKV